MAKTASPFAGIKLTEPTALPAQGQDQRLFVANPKPAVTANPLETETPRNLPSNERRNEGSLETRKLGTLERPEAGEEAPLFDITVEPHHSSTFVFTDDELEALEDAKTDLRRKHDLRATKYDLVRCGLHLLLEDFKDKGQQSFAVRRLTTKRK